jgi:virginiamycin B lyase
MSGKVLYRGLRNSLFCALFIGMIGFSPLRAQITEYAVPFNGLNGIAAGPDGAMWFSGTGNIGRITTAGVVTSYPLPTSTAGSYAIAAGPDGAMWFTEYYGTSLAKIGRITTSGVFTEYALPDPTSEPTSITAGPDGALWFIESISAKIGRITTSGTITEFSLPKSEASGGAWAITAGPDGNLWFTEYYGADKIVRMTTSGVFTEYTVRNFVGAGSYGITVGPDGALWFADANGQIGRITTSGMITEYALPANASPLEIAAGPDGALWYTDYSLSQIGRITASDTVTSEVPTPTNAYLGYIAAGPDGAMWFTEAGGKIGRIPTSVAATPYVCTNAATPVITSVESASSYGGYPYFASGSWIEIKGSNLADPADPRLTAAVNPGQWTANDFSGVNAPTILDGVSVSINGKPAYVWYLSAGQLNVQAPEDTATGSVNVTVTNCKATSSAYPLSRKALAPGLLAPPSFNIGGKQYLVATFNSDGAYVLNTGALAGINSRPAKPGDLILAYGIGFGDVNPSILPGVIVQQSNALNNPVTFAFGATNASLVYAGLAPNFVGLDEFYITVPAGLTNGDYQINVTQNGTALPQTMFLSVHN